MERPVLKLAYNASEIRFSSDIIFYFSKKNIYYFYCYYYCVKLLRNVELSSVVKIKNHFENVDFIPSDKKTICYCYCCYYIFCYGM